MMQRSLNLLAIALLFVGTNAPLTLAQSIAQTQQIDRKSEADRLSKQGQQQYESEQHEAAIASWEAALKIYREIGDRQKEASILNDQGRSYTLLSRYEEGIRAFDQVLSIFQQLKRRNDAAVVLMNRGSAYTALSRHEDALRSYDEALSIVREMNDRSREAEVLMNRSITYAYLTRNDEAIAGFGAALAIFQAANDRNNVAKALMNRGIVYNFISRYDDAIAAFNQALPIFRELKNRRSEASALSSLGDAYRFLSRFEEALTAFDQALPILRAIKDRSGEAGVLMNRGVVYDLLDRNDEAIEAYTEALSIFRSIKNPQGEAEALSNLGIIYGALSRHTDSIQAHTQALSIYRAIRNRDGEALALMNRGIAYVAISRYEDAIRAYAESLVLHRAIKNRNGEAKVLLNQGNAYRALRRYEDAIRSYNEALPVYKAVRDRSGEARALYNLGATYFEIGRFAPAEQSLKSAIAVFESIRLDRLSEANKISFFETQAVSYRILQEVMIAQKKFEAALTISEWGRTKALVERLSQQLQPTDSPSQAAPSAEQLRQIARSQNATLVEYSLNERKRELYIWVVQPTGAIDFRQVKLTDVLPQQCSSIAQLIGNGRQSIGVRSSQSDWLIVDDAAQKNPCAQSDRDANFRALHRLLIEPIASLLPTDPNQHIVFIPDGTLFLVPFAALKATNGQFLIEQRTIRTASSIQLLDKTRALNSRPKGNNVLIVGNPLMPIDPNSTQAKQLSNLPNAEQEARAIAPLFNTQAITGKAGTKQTILQQISDARVIHFATHGSFSDRNGFKSWLALAPSENDSGILTAEEVAQLKLNADLVVLSACDTGRGRVTGDGVVGLSRSFIAAGVPSVIVSLWAVPDAPTADLMKEFYQQLKRNPDKAQALRQAMLTTFRTHPNLKDWAAFTLIGEAR
ncbi:TPR repeat-containing protein (plasmid) [Leptolyngbya boryana NIES-2135]|jgi:CHAT domain-containing protein/Flp pilus assembly protein TadD|uniref:TPR repeat-containing protein n=1 Tax=Leptolyngbya boryana NIES-2135 TaxID=1973484 RepID=A0A1Z4JQT7_LEPBY|nr:MULTISPECIES: CHAT domain-containing protein [Leptolyngbya]BAY59135.1 TPR repeat-containing protein [Leptolyngbya boryana NIES-2135]MBD2372729.1 CHAT domain-containing protein [Leptolyngbya sp. FACHB-238]MBD2402174.1 CHAT domain-containing protein [Leptolyngbya sp. FACHB-239]MBD2403677.1 CHAT domain-containing protein [Leptolyngbya sp. FACHB-402]ULP33335.1 CHAT domain-containing protein [Leptolyngbya boryana IU 594]